MPTAAHAGTVLRRLLPALLATVLNIAGANEVWLAALPWSPAPGTAVVVGLRSGEHFREGDQPFALEATAALQLYSKFAVRNLREQLATEQDIGTVRLTPAYAGTHMIVYDSEPEQVQMSAEEFQLWLHEQDLEQVQQQRAQAGVAGAPARERVRRHAKTLLRVGDKSDGTYGLLTGQRLEIVPTADPHARKPGDTLGFTLLFDSKPLGQTLVKAWNRTRRQTLIIRARTAGDGKVSLSLPYAGIWMIGAAHMIPAADGGEADWDTFRTTLTFELPAAP